MRFYAILSSARPCCEEGPAVASFLATGPSAEQMLLSHLLRLMQLLLDDRFRRASNETASDSVLRAFDTHATAVVEYRSRSHSMVDLHRCTFGVGFVGAEGYLVDD